MFDDSMTPHMIPCPNCGHLHEVPGHHFENKDSRLLRCANCDHIWRHFKNPLPEYEQRLRTPPPPTIMDNTVHLISGFKKKDNYKRAVHHYHMDWWILAIASIIALLILFREVGGLPNINWFWVETQSFFGRLTNKLLPPDMAFRDNLTLNVLTSNLTLKDKASILTVKGEVVNHSEHSKTLPPITIKLMDKCADGNGELCLRHTWDYKMEGLPLNPGERRIFEASGPALKDTLPSTVMLSFQKK